MRTAYPSIRETAAQVLREVDAERLVKTAEHQLLQGALRPRTDISDGLHKLAACLRDVDDDNPEVSYDDLHSFMAQCNAK